MIGWGAGRYVAAFGVLGVLGGILAAPVAVFAAPMAIYGGGNVAAVAVLQDLANCIGVPASGTTANAACAGANAGNGFEYLFAGSQYERDASNSFLYEAQQGGAHVSGPTDAANGFSAFPYPAWELSVTLTPLDALPPAGSGTYATASYNGDRTLNADGLTDRQNRGFPWQIPFAANALAIAYNPAGMNFGIIPAAGDGEDHALQLPIDGLCFLYTKMDAAGNTVAGGYDWGNAIFTSRQRGKRSATVNGGVALAAPGALPIVAFARAGAPGETYQLTQWLVRHCKGYGTAFNSAAKTGSPGATFPVWVATSYSGPAGAIEIRSNADMMAAIAATPGAVGYVDRAVAEPVVAGSLPTAYIENGYSKVPGAVQYVAPSATAIDVAVAGVVPPKSSFHNGGYYSRPYVWGSTLIAALQSRKDSGAYPLTGLAYVAGYSCYDADSSRDNFDGVLDLLSFIALPATAAQADAVLRSHGYEPLDVATKTGANGFTLQQQSYNVVKSDLHHMIGVTSSQVFTNHKSGPVNCPFYRLDKKAS